MSVCRHCGSDHLFTGGKCRERAKITDDEIDARALRRKRSEQKQKRRDIERAKLTKPTRRRKTK